MKILIDFTQIPIKKVGVGIYAMSLLREISKIKCDNTYFIVVLNDDTEVLELLNSNSEKFKILYVNKIFRKLILRFLVEQFYLPILILKNKIDVIHSLHYSFPLIPIKVKKIVTLHDMTFFLYPEFHKKFYVIFFRTIIRASIKGCYRIICVSQSTKEDVIRIFNLQENIKNKLVVIPLGTNFSLNTYNKIETNILTTYNLFAKKYLLFIGTIEPRKNIKSIIEAYSNLPEICLDLVIVGKKGWHYDDVFEKVKELKLEHRIKFTDFVTENEKKQLIFNSYLFIYPSFYEGFGIPLLEAMSFGIPCITSDISSMPEVAGNAAILINPNNVEEISNAIFLLINNNNNIYQSFVKKSLLQAEKFTWEKMASNTMKIYSE
ncbi:glycosyltransferase family 1 protein [Flavobacterium sp. LS1P28]|uniref:glycosyltransferase family 4 protein n=1 Tax=Flavobacterium sp. LS1P28 TaxID=2497752 RepID=UPI000F83B072|nr:glycosyltransferase family 1 protein [Flavobacterium sp. LS1P28]RTY83465.1 glycosyltransferase family 1 protein [Flavobacterium sp. LS1P28]